MVTRTPSTGPSKDDFARLVGRVSKLEHRTRIGRAIALLVLGFIVALAGGVATWFANAQRSPTAAIVLAFVTVLSISSALVGLYETLSLRQVSGRSENQ